MKPTAQGGGPKEGAGGQPADQPLHGGVYRVLVIDDTRSIHDDVRKILGQATPRTAEMQEMEDLIFGARQDAPKRTRKAFRVDSAYQGQEGLGLVVEACAQGQPYSVAFVDARMPPGWDGIETIQHLWEEDPNLQVVICTAYADYSWEEIASKLGHTDGLLILKKPFDVIEILQMTHALASKWSLEWQLRQRLDDLEVLVQQRTRELQTRNLELGREVAERRKAEENLKHLATHDPLTNMPNRVLLNDRLRHALALARRKRSPLGVLLVDLDRFKEINDTLGHGCGDMVLQAVARRLQRSVRECDTVSRLGGDEFVVVLGELSKPEDAAGVARRILAAFCESVSVEGRPIQVGMSIGISLFPMDGSDVESLLGCADMAMYQAKARGRGTCVQHGEADRAEGMMRGHLKEELLRAIEQEEFVLHYQPLFDLQGGSLAGVEALLRWNHPARGLVSPLTFLPVAEESGLIVTIGRWVLGKACRQVQKWQQEGLPVVPVSVNISTRQFYQEGFVEIVQEALQAEGLAPDLLELELTESTAVQDLERSKQVLGRLREMGVRVAIDDFGSGFSSISRLALLPVDCIKIDRMLTRDMVGDPRAAAIVAAIIGLGHSLQLDVVAEGIETVEQLRLLKDPGLHLPMSRLCEKVQGYLFSYPVSVEDATRFLQEPWLQSWAGKNGPEK